MRHPRALVCTAVGINFETTLGIRIEYYAPKSKQIRITTADYWSCRFSKTPAYKSIGRGTTSSKTNMMNSSQAEHDGDPK